VIYELSSSDSRFQTARFRPGLNLVLADRTEQSDEHDSRNGLGKTSLVHLIQFCLGGELPDHLLVPEICRSSYSLDLDVGGARIRLTRSPSAASRVAVSGDWFLPAIVEGDGTLRVDDLTAALGRAFFGLPSEGLGKYAPSLRGLISYFARRGHDAFVSPLKHFHSQPSYQQQILQAFLAGLKWEYPRDQRLLHEDAEAIRALRRAVSSGALSGVLESAGELQARRVQAARRLERLREQVAVFRVHPRYRALQDEANRVTAELRDLSNVAARDRRLLRSYNESLAESVAAIDAVRLEELYAAVNLTLPELVRETLDSVRAFHRQLRDERVGYLQGEIDLLRHRIAEHEERDRALQRERAAVLETLRTHGSVEELDALQDEVSAIERALGEISEQLRIRRQVDHGGGEIRTKRIENQERARVALEETASDRDRLVALFDGIWEALYGVGGRLIIDVTDSGYSFDWEVEREGSEGVGKMKIFAHDLTAAVAWSEKGAGPGFLLHDSTIWDGVDERQIAAGIEVAEKLSAGSGLQYITFLNTDILPAAALDPHWQEAVALRLTDATDQGRLFGFAF